MIEFITSVKKYFIDLTVDGQEQGSIVVYGNYNLITGLWLLITGNWDDNGVWDDTANWID
jgi:hypothetical protein